MKILFITPKIPYPPIDGHKKSMFGVIKHLSMLGHEIDIIAYRQDEDASIADGLKEFAKVFLLDVQTTNSVAGAVKNLFSSVPYNLWKFQRRELIEFLRNYFITNRPDIIQVVNAHMGWLVDELRKSSKSPVILRQENLELSIMEKFYGNQRNLILKLYSFIQFGKFMKYEPSLCSKFDLCVMMSPNDEQKLLSLNPLVKTAIIPLGADEDLFRMESAEKEPYSLFHIGSVAWYPNLDGIKWFIANVFPKVLENYPQTKLYLYGGGFPESFKIEEKINSSIVIKGFVEDIWREVNDKQLAIVPLWIGSGIRVKIIELLAAGHNVISTNLGIEGIPLTDEENILLADSAEDFSKKICRFFNSEFDNKLISDSGRKVIRENFSWETIAVRFENEYKKLINK